MAKSKDNLAALRALNAKANVGTVKTKGESVQPPPEVVVSQTRNQISDIGEKIQIFRDIVKDDDCAEIRSDFYIITMVNELLKGFGRGDPVVTDMGFDRANLRKQRQGIFSIGRETVVSKKEIIEWCTQHDTFVEVVYRKLLKLDEESTREAIKQRAVAFSSHLVPLGELFDFEDAGNVFKTLDACSNQDKEARDVILTKMGFVGTKHIFDEDKVQDREAIKKMLAEPELVAKFKDSREKAEKLRAATKKSKPPITPQRRPQTAPSVSKVDSQTIYQNQYLLGESLASVTKKIKDQFSEELPEKMVEELAMARKKGEFSLDTVERLVKSHKITTSEEAVKKELTERIYRVIGRLYPNLLEENSPARVEMTADLKKFFDAFSEDPTTKEFILPLNWVHNAFRCPSEERYNEKYRATFEEKDRATVISDINGGLEKGVAEKLQSLIRDNRLVDEHKYKTSILRAIAVIYGHSDYDKTFKDRVIFISKVLGGLFPKIKPKEEKE